MPSHSVSIIRLSVIYLCVGATLGALMLVEKGLGAWTWPWLLRPLHEEFLLFGWMVQLAFGVGSWILPRARKRQAVWPLLAACALLNAGIWAAGVAPITETPSLLAAGRLAQGVALAVFAAQMWPRVRSFNVHG